MGSLGVQEDLFVFPESGTSVPFKPRVAYWTAMSCWLSIIETAN